MRRRKRQVIRATRAPFETRLEPISAAQRREYDSRPHASEAEIRAQVLLKAIAPQIAASRAAAPGAAVSGYKFLGALLGRSGAAALPGTLDEQGRRAPWTKKGVALDAAQAAASFFPTVRGLRSTRPLVLDLKPPSVRQGVRGRARVSPGSRRVLRAGRFSRGVEAVREEDRRVKALKRAEADAAARLAARQKTAQRAADHRRGGR